MILRFSEMLTEGVNDPSIFKVVFLAGGPGSGKSFMVKKTALTALGYTIINSDEAFEHLMKKLNLDFKMPDSEQDQRDAAREVAKAIATKKQDLALQGKLGLIIDGTGKDFNKIMHMRARLSLQGYDAAMVFINTDLETALKRNAARARSVPEKIAKELWNDVQKNLGKFQQAFGRNFFMIDNSEGADYESQTTTVYKKIMTWSKEKPKNGVAIKWIEKQRKSNVRESVGLEESTCDLISQQQLKDLEKFGDRLLQKFGLDIEFTKHFGDRMSDSRNTPCIKVSELQSLFKKVAKDKGEKVKAHKDHEAVMKDMQTDLNLPFIVKPTRSGELEVVMKTIMRKKDFKSPDPTVRYEDLDIPSTEYVDLSESEYNGKSVELNKPFRTPGGPKKFAVYVKNDSGKVVIVRFGDPNMEIKRDDPDRRAAFRARHNCSDAKDKTTPRYWSCYQWRAGAKVAEGVEESDICPECQEFPCMCDSSHGLVKNESMPLDVYIPLYIQEAAYEGNIGMMELAKFYQKASEVEKKKLQDYIKSKLFSKAWKLVQDVTGVKLVGKQFHEAESVEEDVAMAANAVAHGGVDMNPTGRPKWDKRSKFDINHLFRRADGSKYGKPKKQ